MKMLDALRALQREMDKYESPSFTVEDFVYFWTTATNEFADSKHVSGPDALQADHDDIRELLSDPTDITFGSSGTATLPDQYRNILELKLTFKMLNRVGKFKKDALIVSYPRKARSSRQGYIGNNVYQQPKLKRSWYRINKKTITVDYDPNVTISKAVMTFYENPSQMYLNPDYPDLSPADQAKEENNSTLQFSDHTVAKIVKVCRRIMLENIESGRYRTVLNENTLSVK